MFLDAFLKTEEHQEVITRASEARLDPNNLTKTIADIKKLYGQAKFDDATKLGFICMAVKDIGSLRVFLVMRAGTDYGELRKAIKDYDTMQKAFCAPVSSIRGSSTQDDFDQQYKPDSRLLVSPDARVKNMETKIDSVTDQIANLTLMIKKTSSFKREEKKKVSYKDGDYDIACSYCKEHGHTSGRCEKHPNKDR